MNSLRDKIKEKGWTGKELATRLNIDCRTVQKWISNTPPKYVSYFLQILTIIENEESTKSRNAKRLSTIINKPNSGSLPRK